MKENYLVGYHYTSWENWKQIRETGLHLYMLERPEFPEEYRQQMGIWVWQENVSGLSHCGQIIYHMAKKASTRIVKLQVLYREESIFRGKLGESFGRIRIGHRGTIQNLVYHEDEPAWIIKEPIPADRIKLVCVYDLFDMVGACEKKRKTPKTLFQTATA